MSRTKVYIGDLRPHASERDLEDAFSYYGRLRSVWVARRPPGFAFVEFEDSRDAEDAIRGMDGRSICGSRVRVEFSDGRGQPSKRARRDSERCHNCHRPGHTFRECLDAPRRRRSRSRSYTRSRTRSPRSRSRSPHRRTRSRSRSRSG